MKQFKVGDKAVHLSYGMGVIKGVEMREFTPGTKREFYIFEIQDNGAPKKAFIPVDQVSNRLRPVVSKADAESIIEFIHANKAQTIDQGTWNMRYRTYMEKIHTGNVREVAEVFVALMQLKDEKDLSFGERKLLDQSLNLIVQECSIAMDVSEAAVVGMLTAAGKLRHLNIVKNVL